MSVETVPKAPSLKPKLKRQSTSVNKISSTPVAGLSIPRVSSPVDISQAQDRAKPVLAVEGLPSELSDLVPGMLYAMMVDTQAIRVALAAQCLSGSAHIGAPSVLVTGHDPHALVKKAKSFAPQLALR
jgi:hypothetical protein